MAEAWALAACMAVEQDFGLRCPCCLASCSVYLLPSYSGQRRKRKDRCEPHLWPRLTRMPYAAAARWRRMASPLYAAVFRSSPWLARRKCAYIIHTHAERVGLCAAPVEYSDELYGISERKLNTRYIHLAVHILRTLERTYKAIRLTFSIRTA